MIVDESVQSIEFLFDFNLTKVGNLLDGNCSHHVRTDNKKTVSSYRINDTISSETRRGLFPRQTPKVRNDFPKSFRETKIQKELSMTKTRYELSKNRASLTSQRHSFKFMSDGKNNNEPNVREQ